MTMLDQLIGVSADFWVIKIDRSLKWRGRGWVEVGGRKEHICQFVVIAYGKPAFYTLYVSVLYLVKSNIYYLRNCSSKIQLGQMN